MLKKKNKKVELTENFDPEKTTSCVVETGRQHKGLKKEKKIPILKTSGITINEKCNTNLIGTRVR